MTPRAVEQVEAVARLDALVVGRQRQRRLQSQQRLAFRLGVGEVPEQQLGVGVFEVVGRTLDLVLLEDVAVGDAAAVPVEVVDVLDALDVHRQPLQPVGQLDRDGTRSRCRRPAGNR